MSSVKDRLKAELASNEPEASTSASGAKEVPAPEPDTEEKAKLQVI